MRARRLRRFPGRPEPAHVVLLARAFCGSLTATQARRTVELDAGEAAFERAAAAADLEAEARAESVFVGGAAGAIERVGPGGYGSNMRVTVDYNAVGKRPPASDVRQLGEPDLPGILGLAGIIQNHIPGSRMDAEARAVELLDDARESITGFANVIPGERPARRRHDRRRPFAVRTRSLELPSGQGTETRRHCVAGAFRISASCRTAILPAGGFVETRTNATDGFFRESVFSVPAAKAPLSVSESLGSRPDASAPD